MFIYRLIYFLVLSLLFACKPSRPNPGSSTSKLESASHQSPVYSEKYSCPPLEKADMASLKLASPPINTRQMIVKKLDAVGTVNRVINIRIAVDKSTLPAEHQDLHGLYAQVEICDFNKHSECQGPNWKVERWNPKDAEVSSLDDFSTSGFDWREEKVVVHPNIGVDATVRARICSSDSDNCGAWLEQPTPFHLPAFKTATIESIMSDLSSNLAARRSLAQDLIPPAKKYISTIDSLHINDLSKADQALLAVANNLVTANSSIRAILGTNKDEAVSQAVQKVATDEIGQKGAGLAAESNDCMRLADSMSASSSSDGGQDGLNLSGEEESTPKKSINSVALGVTLGVGFLAIAGGVGLAIYGAQKTVRNRTGSLPSKRSRSPGMQKAGIGIAIAAAVSAIVFSSLIGTGVLLASDRLVEARTEFQQAIDQAETKLAQLKLSARKLSTELDASQY